MADINIVKEPNQLSVHINFSMKDILNPLGNLFENVFGICEKQSSKGFQTYTNILYILIFERKLIKSKVAF